MLPAMADHAAAANTVTKIGDRMPLVIGLLLTSLTLRPQIVGVGPLVPEIQRAMDMSHAFTGLLVTIPVLCLGIFAPVAPVIAGRIGAINAVTGAGLLIALAGMARAVVPGSTGLILFTFLVGVGMGVGNALMVIAVKERFADRPLLLTAVYSTGIQFGATAAAVVAVPLSLWLGGWRWSLFAMSAASLVFIVAWIITTRNMHVQRQRGVFPRFPLKSSIVWSFAAMFGLMGVVFYGLATWAPSAYVDLGYSETSVGWLAAMYNIGTLPTSLAVGLIGERVTRRQALVTASAVMTLATLLFALVPAFGFEWMLLAGIANGMMFTVTMSLPLDVADSPIDVGAAAGMMLFIGYLITACAPSALGWVRDLTGSFDLVLLAFPVAAGLFCLIAMTLSPARLQRGIRQS
jgi:CP family cyanate transporter-like MFS transporter